MEIIKSENKGYAKYEELLFERENLKKECHQLNIDYIREFGDVINSVFSAKIECIKSKKMISYCQQMINAGKNIDSAEMNRIIEAEMKVYKEKLNSMIKENEAAKNVSLISSSELLKIKRLYHSLAKKLHPDINPKTNEIPELKKIWVMIQISYKTNDLKSLEEAAALADKVLKEEGIENTPIDIKDIENKIKEIEDEIAEIKLKNPYQYKFLLIDEDEKEKKRKDLQKELKEYEDYKIELSKHLTEVLSAGGTIIWQMT